MESIRREQPSNTDTVTTPSILKDFYSSIAKLNETQRLKVIYAFFTKKKPNSNLTQQQLLNRILYEIEFGEKIRETEEKLKKQKKFKFPWAVKGQMKSSLKQKEIVLVFYLNVKNELEWPRLYPVYSGNMVIIRNKPHELDPRAIFTFGKYRCMIFREIDRRPVSNMDFDEVRKRGDSTDSDEFLIKAAMKAMQGGIKKELNKTWIIVGVIIAVIALIFFMMKGG